MKKIIFLCLPFLAMLACQNNEKKAVGGVRRASATDSLPVPAQQVFCLSMIANLPAALCWQHNCDSIQAADSIISHITPIMDSTLRFATDNSNGQNLTLSKWKRVWGPAVIATNGDKSLTNSNGLALVSLSSMTIFMDTSSNYVVAIEATNPNCPYDWISLDLNVFAVSPFDGNPNHGYLTQGTWLGLNNYLLKLTDINQNNITADTFLTRIHSSANSITVTGHSLGGALSPVYALHLKNLLQTSNIYCLSTAGASPGDTAFIRYFNNTMNGCAFRVWNTLDVVPRAWEPDTMKRIDSLYYPTSTSIFFDPQYTCNIHVKDTFPQTPVTSIPTPSDISKTVAHLTSLLTLQDSTIVKFHDTLYNGAKFRYGSICNGGTTFTGTGNTNALYFNTIPFNSSNVFIQLYPNDTAFLSQLGNQHVAAYTLYYNIKGIHEYMRQRVENCPYSAVNWNCNYGNQATPNANLGKPDFTSLWALLHKYAWRW